MGNAERELRAAQNQTLFRSVNQRILDVSEKIMGAVSEIDFACECQRTDCHKPITMSLDEFTEINRQENRFVVHWGHEDPEVEDLVATHDGYLIVAKRGAGAEYVHQRQALS